MPKIRNDMIKNNCAKKPYRKQNIPKAIREQCWMLRLVKYLNINVM